MFPAAADDAAILSQIESANSSLSTVQASFTHKNVKSGKTSNYSGTYYYSAGSLAMAYTTDEESLIATPSALYVKHKGKVHKGDPAHNARMRSLSNTLINCIKGKITTVAEENKADWSLKNDGSLYSITITAKKKASKGYASITLKYRKSDCLLTALRLEEFNGTVNEYALSDIKTGVSVSADLFKIPSKG